MASNSSFTTITFRMSAANFMTTFIFKYAWIWILALSSVGLIGLIVGIVVDIRWFIVGLMVILIILPMISAFLYYTFALKPECYVNIVEHDIELNENGIKVNMLFEEEKTRTEVFEYNDFARIDLGPKSLNLIMRKPRKGFIWVPFSAFETDDTEAAIEYLFQKFEAEPRHSPLTPNTEQH